MQNEGCVRRKRGDVRGGVRRQERGIVIDRRKGGITVGSLSRGWVFLYVMIDLGDFVGI
jgi:hypothetical protein